MHIMISPHHRLAKNGDAFCEKGWADLLHKKILKNFKKSNCDPLFIETAGCGGGGLHRISGK